MPAKKPWHVPYYSLAHRIATLREWLGRSRSPAMGNRIRDRLDVLTAAHDEEVLTLLGKPIVDRAPALARWAEKVQRNRGSSPLELAAAHEVEALAWEEAGQFERAWRARRSAAHALGARFDIAGFHTEPDARA